jgi:hypothetical protein
MLNTLNWKQSWKNNKEDNGIVHGMHCNWPKQTLIFNFDLSEEKPGYNPGNN